MRHVRPGRARSTLLRAVLLPALALAVALGHAAGDAAAAVVCPADARPITYDVAAFQADVPLNGWGDHMPDALIYALDGQDARIGKEQMLANPALTQPIVIRANVGDCVTIHFRNDIADRRAGMHPNGLVLFDPRSSDGAAVGNNPDTTIGTGEEITYTWYANKVGEASLTDIAILDPAAAGHSSVERGLYGAVIVHPRGSTWHNPVTGADLLDQPSGRAVETQVFADVHAPGADDDYRSYVIVFMDENEDVLDRDGNAPTFPTSGLADSTFGFNYRSEPLRNRLRAVIEHRDGRTVRLPNLRVIAPDDHFCDGYTEDLGAVAGDPGARCLGEESHLQSWPYGDHGKLMHRTDAGEIVVDTDLLIPKAYVGDPIRFSVVNPGAKETHPWHQHTQRWYADPDNPDSPRKDVQSIGPGEARGLVIEGGAGGLQGTIGDSIFHCHLYPHFAQGFWGSLRIFDRLRDGSQVYPDGTPMEALQQLPDRAGVTPQPDAEHPGFPLFVKGEVGQRAYRPPNAIVEDDFAAIRRPGDAPRGPTALEAANLPALDATKPGAGFIDPCPAGAPTRTYRPHAVDVPLVYNKAGWTDPEGRIYVEESHEADVLAGREAPQPYTIRSRVGECVQLLTTNDLHLDDDPSVPIDHIHDHDGVYFTTDLVSEISTHVHLVQFDELGTDGTSVGWNYSQSALPGQTYGYRWWVDVALRTVFFHDHQYANGHQQKGLFAAMNVEPKGATWHDPITGAQTDGVGPVADIRVPDGPDFREFTLFGQDRSPMWQDHGHGAPVNPPAEPDDFGADQGGVAFNYRNEPFPIRVRPGARGPKGDPAYVYSSAVFGDPSTPIFRAYPGDPVIIRNVTGAHEEIHTFTLHGHRWLNEPDNPQSRIVDSQTVSLAEYFNYELQGSRVVRSGTRDEAFDEARNAEHDGAPTLLNGGAGAPGDYLYASAPLDDQWLGMWGIFRVLKARTSTLQPLPDRPALATGDPWPALHPGDEIKRASGSSVVCPKSAPVRLYSVSAIPKRIVYNAETGDYDPYGIMYVLAADEEAVRKGTKPATPLYIRANSGDCVGITLANKLPLRVTSTDDVPVPFEQPFPRGNRVSMHASLVNYDVLRSDGATVGYNFDQTIGPGQTITYQWYVDPQLDGAAINLLDFGDRRGHRHHGLWGGMMIEPVGSTWKDPRTGLALANGAAADIAWTDASGTRRARREFVISFQDGLTLFDRSGAPIQPASEIEDPYELGTRAVNYRTERFAPRLADNPEPAWVMSSRVHGDPATPVFRAYLGDPVTVQVLMGQDRGRAHSFILSGHEWNYQPRDPASTIRSVEGGYVVGSSLTLPLIGGAGGTQRAAGDFVYRDGNLVNQVNAGLWGIFRVLDVPVRDLQLLPASRFTAKTRRVARLQADGVVLSDQHAADPAAAPSPPHTVELKRASAALCLLGSGR